MVPPRPDLSKLTEAEKDALILRLLARLEEAEKRIAELEARLEGAAKDTRQLQPTPIHGTESEPAEAGEAGRPAPGQPRSPGRWSPARGGARSGCRRQGGHMRPLSCAPRYGRSRPARALRQDRSAPGPSSGDTGGALSWPMPVLRRGELGAGAGRPG